MKPLTRVSLAVGTAILAASLASPAVAHQPLSGHSPSLPLETLSTADDNQPITADSAVKITFAMPEVSSEPSVDTRLTMALQGKTSSRIDGLLSHPLSASVLTSPFAHRVSPITGQADEFHTGQDYGAPCGADVTAAADGTVVFTGWHNGGGGWRVEIDHGDGLKTTYNHLSGYHVPVGQKVDRGQSIASVGTTGSSTGCHLHFEVWQNGNVTDPLPWL